MAIIHVGFFTKTILNWVWGGGVLFLFRGDGSKVEKLEDRANCLSSFVRGCNSGNGRLETSSSFIREAFIKKPCVDIHVYLGHSWP